MATTAILAKQLTFGFNEAEDRLIVLAGDGQGKAVALALTRRTTSRLLNGLAALLERSNIVASTAPAEVRDDIILMEHQGAVAGAGKAPSGSVEGTGAGQSSAQGSGTTSELKLNAPVPLVLKIDVKTLPTEFQMVMSPASGLPIAMTLNRIDLHRVVEVLKRKTEDVDWNIKIGASWLEGDQTELVLN